MLRCSRLQKYDDDDDDDDDDNDAIPLGMTPLCKLFEINDGKTTWLIYEIGSLG